jgi:archaellum biogenesis protein FlaJ (TadC family)
MTELLNRAAEFWWLAPLSVAMFLATALLVPLLVIEMPADYFVVERLPSARQSALHHLLHLLWTILRNVLGAIVLLAGVLMLFTPGQGVLTILVGLGLCTFPGKRTLELRLIQRPSVHRVVNWIRRRAEKAPLRLP